MAVTTQRLIFLWGSGAPLTLRSIVNFEVAEQIGEWNFCVRFVVPYDRITDPVCIYNLVGAGVLKRTNESVPTKVKKNFFFFEISLVSTNRHANYFAYKGCQKQQFPGT